MNPEEQQKLTLMAMRAQILHQETHVREIWLNYVARDKDVSLPGAALKELESTIAANKTKMDSIGGRIERRIVASTSDPYIQVSGDLESNLIQGILEHTGSKFKLIKLDAETNRLFVSKEQP